MGKDFKMDDSFRVNFSYSNNMYKIKVPVMHSKLKKDAEATDLQLKVEDDRKHMIEATIVKVMKSRRRMTHIDLITESSKILSNKFNPDP